MRNGQSINMGSPLREHVNNDRAVKPEPIVKKFTDKWLAAKWKKTNDLTAVINKTKEMPADEFDIMENNAFRMIGDEDL